MGEVHRLSAMQIMSSSSLGLGSPEPRTLPSSPALRRNHCSRAVKGEGGEGATTHTVGEVAEASRVVVASWLPREGEGSSPLLLLLLLLVGEGAREGRLPSSSSPLPLLDSSSSPPDTATNTQNQIQCTAQQRENTKNSMHSRGKTH